MLADPVQQIDTSALRSSTPPGFAARTAGPGRATTWPPGSAATARTPNGSTASAWPSAPTWAGASSAPGPSSPAAVDERQIGAHLVTGAAAAIDAVLQDKGFTGSRFAAEMADGGIEVIIPPTWAQRQAMPKTLQRLIARLRNRVETSFKEITDQRELARRGARTFEGLLTRTVAALAAHTLLLTELILSRQGVLPLLRSAYRAAIQPRGP